MSEEDDIRNEAQNFFENVLLPSICGQCVIDERIGIIRELLGNRKPDIFILYDSIENWNENEVESIFGLIRSGFTWREALSEVALANNLTIEKHPFDE